jgi:peptidoglycan-N-acetylglucosamine deacetylase
LTGMWPGDIRCVVDLSFDLEGRTPWVQRDSEFLKLPGILSMGDYGPKVGARRILELLDRYDIKATFSAPATIAEEHADLVKNIHSRGHEVINHGYVHEPPTSLSPEQEIEILERSRAVLERVTGEAPVGYKSPGLSPTQRTLGLLAERGYLYDSSLMDDDTPYVVEVDSGRIAEIPVSWEWNDFPYFAYVPAVNIRAPMQTLDGVYHTWAMGFEGAYRFRGCFTLLLHPQIIGRPGRLLMLERLIQHMRSFPGVAFMRGVEIARIVLDRS